MFGKFKRHNKRKQRLSSWFESERDGDTHALDIGGVAASLATYIYAALRQQARKFSVRRPGCTVPAPSKPAPVAR